MTLKEVLKKASEFTKTELDFDVTGDEQSLMTDCGKETLLRLCGEFTDVKTAEKAVAINGKIVYSDFSRKVKRIFKVVHEEEKMPFHEERDGIKVNFDGEAEVTYSYFAAPANLNDEIDLPPKYNVTMLALGTAGEYCYRKGFYKEAETYDKRFSSAVENVTREVRSVNLRKVEI